MALPMAPATSTIEIIITARIWPSLRGKSSRRRPKTNVRTIAQTAQAPPTNQNGFTRRKLPDARCISGDRTNAGGRLRQVLAVLAATRRPRPVRTRVDAAAAVARTGCGIGLLGHAVDRVPDNPQEPGDGDLEDEHHPDESPSQAPRSYPDLELPC